MEYSEGGTLEQKLDSLRIQNKKLNEMQAKIYSNSYRMAYNIYTKNG